MTYEYATQLEAGGYACFDVITRKCTSRYFKVGDGCTAYVSCAGGKVSIDTRKTSCFLGWFREGGTCVPGDADNDERNRDSVNEQIPFPFDPAHGILPPWQTTPHL